MYIAPDTIIKILHNCPLDETYQHTIYFESVSDQSGLAKYTLATLQGVTYTGTPITMDDVAVGDKVTLTK